jgi:hypothetical protein
MSMPSCVNDVYAPCREEANVYKHEPLAPALSPFGRGEGVISFGACVKMRLDETPDARPTD